MPKTIYSFLSTKWSAQVLWVFVKITTRNTTATATHQLHLTHAISCSMIVAQFRIYILNAKCYSSQTVRTKSNLLTCNCNFMLIVSEALVVWMFSLCCIAKCTNLLYLWMVRLCLWTCHYFWGQGHGNRCGTFQLNYDYLLGSCKQFLNHKRFKFLICKWNVIKNVRIFYTNRVHLNAFSRCNKNWVDCLGMPFASAYRKKKTLLHCQWMDSVAFSQINNKQGAL